MPNLGATIWRTILNIKLLKVCAWITVMTFTKIYWILPMHSNVTINNVSWPHFSWATLYMWYRIVSRALLGVVYLMLTLIGRSLTLTSPLCNNWLGADVLWSEGNIALLRALYFNVDRGWQSILCFVVSRNKCNKFVSSSMICLI